MTTGASANQPGERVAGALPSWVYWLMSKLCAIVLCSEEEARLREAKPGFSLLAGKTAIPARPLQGG